MALLTNALRENANSITRGLTANTNGYCVALVTEADEGTNLCNVIFMNPVTATRESKNDVPVDLRNHQNWFPEKGDLVMLDNSGKSGMIVSQCIDSYTKVKAQLTLTQDILADGTTGMCDGTIL